MHFLSGYRLNFLINIVCFYNVIIMSRTRLCLGHDFNSFQFDHNLIIVLT